MESEAIRFDSIQIEPINIDKNLGHTNPHFSATFMLVFRLSDAHSVFFSGFSRPIRD